MKKLMTIGPVGAGKTSLIHALSWEPGRTPQKTQSICFHATAIDTPGEYCQIPRFYPALLITAMEAAALLIIQDATRCMFSLPPGFAGMFARPVVGVITKMDLPGADAARAKACLKQAGVKEPIFCVSARTGEGLFELKHYLTERGWNNE
jgi:ethanolamine utilization protein EutP